MSNVSVQTIEGVTSDLDMKRITVKFCSPSVDFGSEGPKSTRIVRRLQNYRTKEKKNFFTVEKHIGNIFDLRSRPLGKTAVDSQKLTLRFFEKHMLISFQNP